MNVQPLTMTPDAAAVALGEYKAHRNTYDKRDWEIERIYRQISKGKTVISVNDAIVRAGTDETGRPHLAICRADADSCLCRYDSTLTFQPRLQSRFGPTLGRISVAWPNFPRHTWWSIEARLPRIPPQHRPPAGDLEKYHILWEADWTAIPRDPYLLKRIGKDAWVVLAAWDLTDVEMSVLRAHQ